MHGNRFISGDSFRPRSLSGFRCFASRKSIYNDVATRANTVI
jgi:hypothetical protein